jgi:hypothetical protein
MIKMIDLFKGFAYSLPAADPLLVILPYAATKQHYTPINSNKHIQTIEIEEPKMLQFFQPYYKKQLYSLSGYFHIKSSFSYSTLIQNYQVAEWLDTHGFSLKLFPSQTEEMVPVGALCFSNLFMHREELKRSIMSQPKWIQDHQDNIPFFDIYVSDFLANHKKTKMLFVSAKRSKQGQIIKFFKELYDGSPNPQGSMMLLIPLMESTHYSPEYCSKIMFNHDKCNGDEAAVCIGGFTDLKTPVKRKNGSTVSLQALLKGFPASLGISHALLFQT